MGSLMSWVTVTILAAGNAAHAHARFKKAAVASNALLVVVTFSVPVLSVHPFIP